MKPWKPPSPSTIEMQALHSALESLRCASDLLKRTRRNVQLKSDRKAITSILRSVEDLDENFRVRYLELRDKI